MKNGLLRFAVIAFLSSIPLSSLAIIGYIYFERQEILKIIDMHFAKNDCISAAFYSDEVLGSYRMTVPINICRSGDLSFKVRRKEILFNQKTEYWDNSNHFKAQTRNTFFDQTVDQHEHALLESFFGKTSRYDDSELDFLIRLGEDLGHHRFAMTLEEWNSYFDYNFYFLEIVDNARSSSKNILDTEYFTIFDYDTSYYTRFKLQFEYIYLPFFAAIGIFSLIIFIVVFTLDRLKES